MVYDPGTSGKAEDKAVEIARRVRFLDFIIWVYGVEIRPLAAVSIKAEYIAMHDQNQIFWKEYHLGSSMCTFLLNVIK